MFDQNLQKTKTLHLKLQNLKFQHLSEKVIHNHLPLQNFWLKTSKITFQHQVQKSFIIKCHRVFSVKNFKIKNVTSKTPKIIIFNINHNHLPSQSLIQNFKCEKWKIKNVTSKTSKINVSTSSATSQSLIKNLENQKSKTSKTKI